MKTPFVVLIAASGQPALLRRTLQSLVVCDKPANFRGILVVENGPRCGLDAIVAEFSPGHNIAYAYSEPANKSLALNRALVTASDALVLFTDDDVRAERGALVAYASAAAGCSGGKFFGGPILPEYEAAAPPEWLLPFLPRSAAGWSLPRWTEISQPEFIGPNWCAFAADVLRVGGFDLRLGPGQQMISPGEDTEIQYRLLANHVRGYYVPRAGMHHFVRAGNIGPRFALERAERNGIYWGIHQASRPGYVPRRWLKIRGQWLNDCWRIARWRRRSDETASFRADFVAARWRGRWRGLRAGWNWKRWIPPAIEPLDGLEKPDCGHRRVA